MSIESSPPNDSKPNLEQQPFDVVAELIKAQATYDSLDEFEQMSVGMSVVRDLNNRLENEKIDLIIETDQIGLRADGSDELNVFSKEDGGQFTARGPLLYIDAGWLNHKGGYLIVLASTITMPDARDEKIPCRAYIHMKSIKNYQYQAVDPFDKPSES